MLNHEVFDAIIFYYNIAPDRNKIKLIQFLGRDYQIKVDLAIPAIILTRYVPELANFGNTFGIYYLLKNGDYCITSHIYDTLSASTSGAHFKDVDIDIPNTLFLIYNSIYA